VEESIIYKFLNDDEFLRISEKIREVEKTTSGEICVSIREKLPFTWRKTPVAKIAEEEFFRIGINKTRDKTGILIFILLGEHKFQILADEGINVKVMPHTWDSIKEKMEEKFTRGEYCKGILYAVETAGKILSEHFPIKPDDRNELSNKVFTR
jgi:uncharacterized membrane protein